MKKIPLLLVLFFFVIVIAKAESQNIKLARIVFKCSPDNPIIVGSPYVYVLRIQNSYSVVNDVARQIESLTDPFGKLADFHTTIPAWIDGSSIRWNQPGRPSDERWGNHLLGYKNSSESFGIVFVGIGTMEGTENAYPFCVQFEKID